MTFHIGTDEAGYGPNLGPLVIGASVWRTENGVTAEGLYAHLADCISPVVDPDRVAIADSKALYKPGCGFAALERVVLGVLTLLGHEIRDWHSLWTALARFPASDLAYQPWYAEADLALPHDAAGGEVQQAADQLGAGLAAADCQLVKLAARAIFPDQFNSLVRGGANKAEVLSLTTLRTVSEILEALPAVEDVVVTCDKHGGRGYYAGLLQHVFPLDWIRVLREGREESAYRFSCSGRQVEVRFIAKGERMLATALASMAAKYLREIAMIPFNRFWQQQLPGLAPTAGYPQDARRFRQEISPTAQRLKIAEEAFWRIV